MKKIFVSAIVPIFNEEKTVEKIISLLLESDLVSEVICVNDGSTDKTALILKTFQGKITVITLKKNRGKGFALSKGVEKARGDLVLFIDSDLKQLSLDHIKVMLKPLKCKKYKGVLGVALGKKRTPIGNINAYLDKFITGERVYRRDLLLPHVVRMAKTGYGVEIFLNSIFKNGEVKTVFLKGLISPSKESKGSIKRVVKAYINASTDITQELGKQILKKQYARLKKLALIESF